MTFYLLDAALAKRCGVRQTVTRRWNLCEKCLTAGPIRIGPCVTSKDNARLVGCDWPAHAVRHRLVDTTDSLVGTARI